MAELRVNRKKQKKLNKANSPVESSEDARSPKTVVKENKTVVTSEVKQTPNGKIMTTSEVKSVIVTKYRYVVDRPMLILFGLAGVAFGVFLAIWFYHPTVRSAMSIPVSEYIPAFDLDRFSMAEISGMYEAMTSYLMKNESDLPRPGVSFAKEGITGKHPVVMIPGIVSTGLELWQGAPCAKKYFRQRMWGTLTMMETFLLNPKCWFDHLRLDRATGLDPPGIKLRAAAGLEAADYLLPGFWIWGKIIENLADLGYDANNLHLASYDWRLSPQSMEARDGYMSRLKRNIELLVEYSGQKAIVATHSMGSNVFYFFMNWVESEGGGKGGSKWVDQHIEAFVSIGGPLLGCPKAVSSVVSGEMRDTAQLGALQTYFVDRFSNAFQRRDLFRSWLSIGMLLPKGGNKVWGSHPDGAPDDQFYPTRSSKTFAHMLSFRAGNFPPEQINKTADDVNDYLMHTSDRNFSKLLSDWYSVGVSSDFSKAAASSKYWSNPLETKLPNAPNMKIYCFYGVGKATERAYYYRDTIDIATNNTDYLIDTTVSLAEFQLTNGVQESDGDGTVPLLSLGYMCVEGWKNKKLPYNPSQMRVVTKEYRHEVLSLMSTITGMQVRGGPNTADHVDILGNHQLLSDFLHIAAGNHEKIHDEVITNIKEISAKVKL